MAPGSTTYKQKTKRGVGQGVKSATATPQFMTPVPNLSRDDSRPNKDFEETITACLLQDELVEKIVGKLAEKIKNTVVESLTEALKKAEEKIGLLNAEIDHLKSKFDKSVKRSDDLEQYTRRNNIRVFGIPEKKGEDTDDEVVKVFKEKMQLDITKYAIDRSHRVGEQPAPNEDGSKRYRPIIVKFVSYRDKKRVYEKKKMLKGTKITVREDLTASRLEVWRAAVERFGVRNTWTADGRILWMKDGKKSSATSLSDIPSK